MFGIGYQELILIAIIGLVCFLPAAVIVAVVVVVTMKRKGDRCSATASARF